MKRVSATAFSALSLKSLMDANHCSVVAGSKLDRDLSFNRLCATLGNVAAELVVQPHQAITPIGGGGASNELGWRDDKDKDNQRTEPFYKPSKRRR